MIKIILNKIIRIILIKIKVYGQVQGPVVVLGVVVAVVRVVKCVPGWREHLSYDDEDC